MTRTLKNEVCPFFATVFADIAFVTLFSATFFVNAFEASFMVLWMYPCGLTTAVV